MGSIFVTVVATNSLPYRDLINLERSESGFVSNHFHLLYRSSELSGGKTEYKMNGRKQAECSDRSGDASMDLNRSVGVD